MGRRGYTAEFRRRVLDLVAAGRRVEDIARDLGISDQTRHHLTPKISSSREYRMLASRRGRNPDRAVISDIPARTRMERGRVTSRSPIQNATLNNKIAAPKPTNARAAYALPEGMRFVLVNPMNELRLSR